MAMNAELTQEQDLLPPALVDREGELALLRQRMTEAREGAGATVIVAGEAGMGKTRLLEEAAEVAASQNMLFFQGIGSQSTSGKAGGLKNREPLKAVGNRRHLKVAAIRQTNPVDRAFGLLLAGPVYTFEQSPHLCRP